MTDKEILGEWVNTSPYDDKGECSRCCYVSKKYYSFCPNCGADMRHEKAGMTNKQAAEILKAYSYHDILPQDVKDALEIAIKIVNEVIDEVNFDENEAMSQNQSSDVNMQIRIIKGDLQYLAEKVNKLSSLIAGAGDKEVD